MLMDDTQDPALLKSGKRATIRDVARLAGVAVGTASLALADSNSIAPATKDKVRSAAARLKYQPSAVGRALQAKRMNAVGLIVPHSSQHVFSHLYFMEVLAGVSEVLDEAGMTLVLSTSLREDEEEEAYLKITRSQLVDGVILASAALADKNIARLQAGSHPFVFIGNYPLDASVPAVSIDDLNSARSAVAHLIGHGHRRIAHISGPLPHLSAADRFAGYKETLAAAGLPFRPEYLYEGEYGEESGRSGMRALLQLSEPPTALFAANDETAVGAIEVLRANGIVPGAAFPIVSFDDVMIARLLTPPLTTIRQPMRGLGAAAARLLLALLNNDPDIARQQRLPTELVVRGSCGCPA